MSGEHRTDPWAELPEEMRQLVAECELANQQGTDRDVIAARTALASALLPLLRDKERIDRLAKINGLSGEAYRLGSDRYFEMLAPVQFPEGG